MIRLLKPIDAVRCPSTKRIVEISKCDDCECFIEKRLPWHRWIIKCDIGDKE